MDTASVAAITTICFLFGELVKVSKIPHGWIPVIVGVIGALLGAAGLYVMPGYPADDIISAIAVGVASGLAATGAHQAFKQLTGGSPEPVEYDLDTDWDTEDDGK